MHYCAEFFKIYIKFPMFRKKKRASYPESFWNYRLRMMCLFKCITGLLSENPLAVNVLTSPQNSLNHQKSTFIVIFLHSEPNWVRKSYFQLELRFYDCSITPWLETTSILLVIERIYSYKFKSKYLKNYKPLALLCWNVCNIHKY